MPFSLHGVQALWKGISPSSRIIKQTAIMKQNTIARTSTEDDMVLLAGPRIPLTGCNEAGGHRTVDKALKVLMVLTREFH